MRKILIIIMLSTGFNGLRAQSDSTGKSKIKFKLSANYNSNLNYYGRTDSLKSSGFFPMAELWFNDNFYFNVAPVFVHNASTQFDYAGTVATIGYQFFSTEKTLSCSCAFHQSSFSSTLPTMLPLYFRDASARETKLRS